MSLNERIESLRSAAVASGENEMVRALDVARAPAPGDSNDGR